MHFRVVLAFVLAVAATFSAMAVHINPDCILFEDSYGARLASPSGDVALWWASPGWKVAQDRAVPKRGGKRVEIRAAQNEAEAAQLVVSPTQDLSGLVAEATALTGEDGAAIPASAVDVLRVRYVPVERPTDSDSTVAPWPDPLPPFKEPIDVKGGTNQPLWIRVMVPKGTAPGEYDGAIQVKADGFSASVPLRVGVYDFELPDRMTLSTAFGFNPGNVFSYQKITDPEQQRAVLEKYWADYSAHHISPYDPAPNAHFTVEWVKLAPGEGAGLSADDRKLLEENALTPRFDWTAWDAEMDRVFSQYHFTSFRLGMPNLDEPQKQGFEPGSRGYTLAFNAYGAAMQEHFREKGWLDEAYIYWFDEPTEKDYPHVMDGFARLKEAMPEVRRMLTEQVEPGLVGGPNLWCPLTMWYDHEAAEARRAEGDSFWWYICTIPKKPYCGLFTDHPGTDFRVWLWQTWQYGIEGILIWHTNLWTTGTAYPNEPQNPYEDAMSWMSGYGTKVGEKRPWGNGDGRFVYPPEAAAAAQQAETILDGPVDTMRWEMLRDGIEDYEYLSMLKRLIDQRRADLRSGQLKRFERLLEVPKAISVDLKTYTKDPAPIEKQRDRIARAIEQLSRMD
ncbi:MAG TPA: DUF6067 family protein [Candidatus Hydrogenedentes bacterium]|nr:DUF6067 family protein [Candidatus Hydrogenedentota bacterium]HPG65884.1 DUF6067 family protein [Candidatus Hydrogenedentota bacterium]